MKKKVESPGALAGPEMRSETRSGDGSCPPPFNGSGHAAKPRPSTLRGGKPNLSALWPSLYPSGLAYAPGGFT